jgi:hypothetical protein
MKESFLEYTKYILDRVSFDLNLLKKEYLKALSLLKKDEVLQLDNWIKRKGLQLQPILLKKSN